MNENRMSVSNKLSKSKSYSFTPRAITVKMPKPPKTRRIKFSNNFNISEKGSFGSDGIKITIGNKIQDPHLEYQPGPADYEVPSDYNSLHRIYHKIVFPKDESRKKKDEDPIPNYVLLPQDVPTPIYIPKLYKFEKRSPKTEPKEQKLPKENKEPIDKKGSNDKNKPKEKKHRHKVKKRDVFSIVPLDNNPKIGPGYYNPNYPSPSCNVPNLSKDPKRGSWMIREEGPGPGMYSPKIPFTDSYSFSKHNPRNKGTYIYAIDKFIINIPNKYPETELNEYLLSTPEVQDFIRELSELILNNKPEDPVGYIRNTYFHLKTSLKMKELSSERNFEMF